MKIVVKQTDELSSSLNGDKSIGEYLIYLMEGKQPIEAHIAYGESAKKNRINDIILRKFVDNDWVNCKEDELVKIISNKINEFVEEVSFDEFKELILN